MLTTDGANLNPKSEEKESVVSKIISRNKTAEETTEEKAKDEEETSKEKTSKEETENQTEAESEEETKTIDEEGVIVVVTKEFAEENELDESLIGKEVLVIPDKDDEADSKNNNKIGEQEITEELADVLGLPKTFIGKPLSEAGKSYKETVKWENKNNQAIKDLQKNMEDLISKISDKDFKKFEKEANKEAADEIPDPVTEPEVFSEWLKKRDDLIMGKVLEKVGQSPTMLKAEEMAAKELENSTITSLQANLPKGVKAADILNDWFEENQDDYEDMVKSGLYKNKPQKLIKDIINWYKAGSFDSLKNMKESDIKKIIHNKTVENLKAKGNKTKIKYSSNPRNKTEPNTAVGRILANLEKANALKET